MSLRLRFKYQYRSWVQALSSLHLPDWMTGAGARLTIGSLVVVLSILYVGQISTLSTSGYEVRDLEKQQSKLQREVEGLTNETASWQSMASIQKRLGELSMVPVTDIHYVKGSVDVAIAR